MAFFVLPVSHLVLDQNKYRVMAISRYFFERYRDTSRVDNAGHYHRHV